MTDLEAVASVADWAGLPRHAEGRFVSLWLRWEWLNAWRRASASLMWRCRCFAGLVSHGVLGLITKAQLVLSMLSYELRLPIGTYIQYSDHLHV